MCPNASKNAPQRCLETLLEAFRAKMSYLDPNWSPLWEAWGSFFGPLGTKGGPLGTKMEPKGAKRRAKGTNSELKGIPGAILGTLQKHKLFVVFCLFLEIKGVRGDQKAPQRGPNELKISKKSPKYAEESPKSVPESQREPQGPLWAPKGIP